MATRMNEESSAEKKLLAVTLLTKAGYDSFFVDENFSRLGAATCERDCTVENWLRNKRAHELDMLIEQLQNEIPQARAPQIEATCYILQAKNPVAPMVNATAKSAAPARKMSARPAPKETARPAPKESARPAPKESARPAPKESARPAPKKG